MVVAADENDVIGRDGKLPWHLPEDLKRFRSLTMGHAVVAGRTTHYSIVERLGHPLPGRFTLVASRTITGTRDGAVFLPTIDDAVAAARAVEAFSGGGEIFVIGGAEVYRATLDRVDRIYLTLVHDQVEGDTTMPAGWLDGFTLVTTEERDGFGWMTFERA
jgi:dihydrofolate reductase